MSPKASAAGNGPGPTAVLPTTVVVAGSISATLFSPLSGTKTWPFGAIAGFAGCAPTWIVATTLFVAGSIRVTVPGNGAETQTLSAATAGDAGPLCAVSIATKRFVAGSTRKIEVPNCDPTQIAPVP